MLVSGIGMGQTTGTNDGLLTQASAGWHKSAPMSSETVEGGTWTPCPRTGAGNCCVPLGAIMPLELQLSPPLLLSSLGLLFIKHCDTALKCD